ncbi:MAG: hypothetical protein B6D44_15465 [Ignavibacteriales bacterium UTCHB2]|nr:MAG: hypothetical protein B6D44_15465 [Ignavibacteriales bacterium UTCHB2]
MMTIIVLGSSFILAQRPVKEDFIPYFSQILPPPQNCLEAFNKMKCTVDNCNADNLFDALIKKCDDKNAEITAPTGSVGDMMKELQDPEFQKKLDKMSDEEKTAWAMKISQQYQPQSTHFVPEPENVNDALDECSNIDDRISQDLENLNQLSSKNAEFIKKYDDMHLKIDNKLKKELEKVPMVTKGEVSFPNPEIVKSLKLAAADEHIAVENEYLKAEDENWKKELQDSRNNLTKFENLLAKTHYGDDAKNEISKQTLASHQSMIVSSVISLAKKSKYIFENAAKYIVNKELIGQQ